MTRWVLPRQKTVYSCGAACIRAVSQIEAWPELGLAEGEANPLFLQRSVHRFLDRWCC